MGGKSKTTIGAWHVVLCACALMFGGLYLYLASSIAQDHFAFKEMTAAIQELRDKNSSIKVQASQEQSLDKLELASAELDLEEVRHISYIEVKDFSPLVFANE